MKEVCRECGAIKSQTWLISHRTPITIFNDNLEFETVCPACDWKLFVELVGESKPALALGAHLAKRVTSHKGGARTRGIPFFLTLVDVYKMWTRQGGRCEFTGIEFKLGGELYYGLSIDRIVNDRGYSVGNTRLVLGALNKMKGTIPDDIFRELCESVANHKPLFTLKVG